ncbi:MAG: SPFH domain-containing protein [Symbiobacteriaceae bacterium]|nr:SPFH domain-containing protein [Symbiobacteriaceae bacterium]
MSGIINRVLGQFINVIEWSTPDKETLVYRFDTQGREIMMGAQLTVRETQVAIFINEGQLADLFPPGRYDLNTENMPVLTLLKSWKYGFNSPFKAEVYFVNTMQFTDRKWGTSNPVMMRDADFGMLRLRAFGGYAFRVNDPVKFVSEVIGTNGLYKVSDIDDYLRNHAVSAVSEAIAKAQIPALDIAMHYSEIGEATKGVLSSQIADIGLTFTNFFIENISLPPEVEKAMDTRTSMGVMGDLNRYTQFRAAEAIGEAAKNPGGGAALGVTMGAGQVMGQVMAQAMSASATAPTAPATTPTPTVPATIPTPAAPTAGLSTAPPLVTCPHCGKQVTEGKFCMECGNPLPAAVPTCAHCGTVATPGAKFCPECGKPL